jgi:hypothetical protein
MNNGNSSTKFVRPFMALALAFIIVLVVFWVSPMIFSPTEVEGAYETPPIQVNIDIKPGSNPNSINLGNKGNVPVEIFGNSIDVNNIDPSTICFAGAQPVHWAIQNANGTANMILQFSTQDLKGLNSSSTQATLSGSTKGGQSFTGTDYVNIVQPKK